MRSRLVHWRNGRDLIPGWTGIEEQRYFRSYARDEYTGTGELVDLGCLLGSTTIPLASGLAANRRVSRKRARIHAYDLFEWYPWMSSLSFGRTYEPGESFLGEFERRIARYTDLITIYPGDIQQIGWHNTPIEFLLVDLNKSFELCDYIYRTFFPHLIVGESLVLEQDFKHFYTPWIHLMHYRLRHHFALHANIDGCSVAFRPVKRINPEDIPMTNLHLATEGELDEAYAYSLHLIGPGRGWQQANVVASRVMFYLHLERTNEARRAFEHFVSEGYTLSSDLEVCRNLIEEQKSKAREIAAQT
jgi:hypothetical protein